MFIMGLTSEPFTGPGVLSYTPVSIPLVHAHCLERMHVLAALDARSTGWVYRPRTQQQDVDQNVKEGNGVKSRQSHFKTRTEHHTAQPLPEALFNSLPRP